MTEKFENSIIGKYRGERTIDGVVVTFNGIPITSKLPNLENFNFSFEWGYEGEGPLNLAYALILHSRRDAAQADKYSNNLMGRLISKLSNDWEIDSDELEKFIRQDSND